MTSRKKLKSALNFTIFILCLVCFALTANAQKKRRTTVRTVKPVAASSPAMLKSASQKVSIQLKNVSKFVYILGGVAKDIETLDADIRDRRIQRQAVIEKNTRDKEAVVTSIANLQAGLAALENEFQTTYALKNYTLQIGGITQLAAQSRSEAAAGQLTQSGKTLLVVIEKLSDTLVALP